MTSPAPASETTDRFDMIVIGAGPGGYVAAIRAAQLGLKVAVVEREALGGICLNWGCIPTKALLRSAELFDLMGRAAEFGLSVEGLGFDLDAVVKRSRKVAARLSAGVKHLLKKNGVTVVMGTARFLAPDRLAVETAEGMRTLHAADIVIATGARARELPGLEPDGQRVWAYRDALKPPHMPNRLLVVGSGAIGMEFASFFNTLGAETTVVEVVERILPAEDAEIAAFAAKQFARQGMTIRPNTTVTALDRRADGVTATLKGPGGEEAIEVDTVIVAVGITANTEGLGLEEIGVRLDRGHVAVDAENRTGVGGVWAIGDVAGPPWLAHKASHEGVAVAERIAGRDAHPLDPARVPGCTYCHPQIASVGLTEEQAKAAGHELRIGRFPLIGNGKAIALGEPEGLVKTIFDARTGALLGAHMVGPEVTEMIQGFAIGQVLETTEAELIATIFPHPTLSEAMHESVLAAFDRVIHV